MADDPHLDVLRRWMTPAELEQLRRACGDADEITERVKHVDQIIAQTEQRKAIWQFVRMVGLAFVTVMGAVATIKAILPAGWWP